MVQIQQDKVCNRLLRAFTPDDFSLLVPALEPVAFGLREVLIGAHQPIVRAYFVEEGVISVLAETAGPSSSRIEVGLVGREGLVGYALVLGTDRSPHVSFVQVTGSALSIPADALQAAMDRSATLRGMLGRYVQSLIVQVGQTAYANIDLKIEARLARWIVMMQDRLGGEELPLTHEFLSLMLGVRRPAITTATHTLEGERLIRARRGRIIVVDREKLVELAGAAYGLAEAEYQRLFEEASTAPILPQYLAERRADPRRGWR